MTGFDSINSRECATRSATSAAVFGSSAAMRSSVRRNALRALGAHSCGRLLPSGMAFDQGSCIGHHASMRHAGVALDLSDSFRRFAYILLDEIEAELEHVFEQILRFTTRLARKSRQATLVGRCKFDGCCHEGGCPNRDKRIIGGRLLKPCAWRFPPASLRWPHRRSTGCVHPAPCVRWRIRACSRSRRGTAGSRTSPR